MKILYLVSALCLFNFLACKGKNNEAGADSNPAGEKSASGEKKPQKPEPEPAEAENKDPAELAKGKEPEQGAKSPVPDIPEGRSKPPTVSEWQQAEPINTQEPHSRAENCEMKIVREWLKVYCHGDITEYSELSGFGEKMRDYFVSVRKGKSADFVVRLRKGETMKVKVHRNDAREAVLYASWPHGADKPVHIALGQGNPPDKKKK